jgi:hypothetical protein
MCCFAMRVKLLFEGPLVLLAVGPVAGALRSERGAGTQSTSSFDGNVAQPFSYPNGRFTHRRFAFGASGFGDFSFFPLRTNTSPRLQHWGKISSLRRDMHGLPDCLPNYGFSSSGVLVTSRPCRFTGITSEAQRCTTAAG